MEEQQINYPLPRSLNRHGIELYLMNDKQLKIWYNDVRKLYPTFPFDSEVLRRIS